MIRLLHSAFSCQEPIYRYSKVTTNHSSSYIAIFCTKEINTQQICVVADNISPEINNLSVVFMYCIYNISFIGRDVRKSNIDFIEISCPPMKRQTIICIKDFW